MKPDITPVMIVRDESRYLPGALAAIAEAGPQTFARACVYDTGSTDGTQDLARRSGAVVRQGYWDDDFARARNVAAEMATTRWVLGVDADERVVVDPAALAAVMRDAEAASLDCLAVEIDDIRGGSRVNTALLVRLYRPSIAEHVNRIHEQVQRRDGGELHGRRLPREALRIEHLSYGDPERRPQRADRNIRIGELDVAEARAGADPGRVCEALVNRGRAHLLGGRREAAESDWAEARALGVDSPFAVYAGELLVDSQIDTGRLAQVPQLLRELAAEGLDPMMVGWLAAQACAAIDNRRGVLSALRTVREPVSAMGERLSVAPLLQARMLAAAAEEHNELALADAIELMARHGVFGFARLSLLLWGDRPPQALAGLLMATDRAYRDRLIGEFDDLGGLGSQVSAHLSAAVSR